MIDDDGVAHLGDFRITDIGMTHFNPGNGTVVGVIKKGNVRYLAPELLFDLLKGGGLKKKFTKESDIYSFGMTAYEVRSSRIVHGHHQHYPFVIRLSQEPNHIPGLVMTMKLYVKWRQNPYMSVTRLCHGIP